MSYISDMMDKTDNEGLNVTDEVSTSEDSSAVAGPKNADVDKGCPLAQ